MATIFDPRRSYGTAREALLADKWWAAAIRGVSAIVLGSVAIALPVVTLFALAIVFAAYCFVDGVFALVLAIRGARAHERWGWLALNGLLSIGAAAIAAFHPFLTVFAFVILFALWGLMSGAATIAAAARLGKGHGRIWLILGGVIPILFALVALFSPPLGMLAIAYLVGFQALLAGFMLLALAFRLRSRNAEEKAAGARTEAKAAEAGHA
ncbi:MAG: hypothetical protein QOH81_2702 [Sphingomonadales bacterium]|jgi:uncharacterized membrane protein HdeD (DUF308 family)|nr:hypothetical protein [Sphingomonadales bacterium]